jgi:hypothetical protein
VKPSVPAALRIETSMLSRLLLTQARDFILITPEPEIYAEDVRLETVKRFF